MRYNSVRKQLTIGKRQSGLAMVESMVSLLIAAIAISGLWNAVSSATRLGITAQQTTEITLASRMVFAQLRMGLTTPRPTTWQIHLGTRQTPLKDSAAPLEDRLQAVVDNFSAGLDDLQSDIDCSTTNVTACEVCFSWHDAAKAIATTGSIASARSAVNRIVCQTQLVQTGHRSNVAV